MHRLASLFVSLSVVRRHRSFHEGPRFDLFGTSFPVHAWFIVRVPERHGTTAVFVVRSLLSWNRIRFRCCPLWPRTKKRSEPERRILFLPLSIRYCVSRRLICLSTEMGFIFGQGEGGRGGGGGVSLPGGRGSFCSFLVHDFRLD